METITRQEVSEARLSDICHKHFGSDLASSVELKNGWFCAAYLLRSACGREGVVKIAPLDSVRLMRYEKGLMRTEVTMLRLVREKTSLPVPEVFAYDTSREEVESDYFLMERLHGQALNLIRAELGDEVQSKVDHQVGVYVKELHQLKGTGFGIVDGPLFASWAEGFERLTEWLRADAVDMGVELPEGAFEAADAQRWALEDVSEPTLTHWDLWDGNVFVDTESGQVTGIIDFERCLWGDPLVEHNFLEPKPGFMEAYGADTLSSESARARRLYYDLYLYLLMTIECSFRKYPPDVEVWCRGKLGETLLRCRA